jgi:L-ascorbate metabolism protein UlaG (beta-lactamase superfamily)
MAVKVTWWGHATTTIELGGLRILTDPVLHTRLAHLRRVSGPNPDVRARQADAVLISHLHADHLHIPSLRELGRGVRIIAPRGTAGVLRSETRLLDQLEEIDVDGAVEVGGLRIRAVPAAHDGHRLPGSRHVAPALGFVLATTADSVWFAGDTGLFDAMSDIGPVGTAIVPVGGWGPTLGPHHLDPAQGAEAVRRVGARDAVPVHYGTFWPVGLRRVHPPSYRRMFADPGARFAAALAQADPGSRAHVLGLGESIRLGPR